MAEWSIAPVCKTVARKGSGGSNPPRGTRMKNGLIIKVLIVLVVVLLATIGYLVFNRKPAFAPVSTPTPTPESGTENKNMIFISTGQQFTLKKSQIAKISDTGFEVKITAFYNSPCPVGAQCNWSGVGIGFEYNLNGKVLKGTNLVQAFEYTTIIVKSDYETYADLIIEKIMIDKSK